MLVAVLFPRIKAGAEEDPQGPRDLHPQVEAGAEDIIPVETATAATMAEIMPIRCGLPPRRVRKSVVTIDVATAALAAAAAEEDQILNRTLPPTKTLRDATQPG